MPEPEPKPNDGTGVEDPKPGQEPKPEPKPKSETHTIKVDGVDVAMTLEELKENATKAAGADKRFREAKEIWKEGDEGRRIKTVFNKVFNSDEVSKSDIRELAELMGQDPDAMIKLYEEELDTKPGKDKGKPTPSAGAKIKPEDLPDEDRATLDQARKDQVAAAEREINNQVEKAVDKDDFFGKIITETAEEQRDDRKSAIASMVQRSVRAKILASPYTKEKFGAEMIRNSIQEIRAEIKKFGIPSKSASQATPSLLAALGPTGGLPAEVHSDDKIDRVASTDEGYADNVVKRLGQRIVQSMTGR